MATDLSLDSIEERAHRERLSDILKRAEEESRMVLPGIQALFGFQLIAVFNQGFRQMLSPHERMIHLGALACVAIASTLVLAPAAEHRLSEPAGVSKAFVCRASRYLTLGLAPLLLGTCLDFYLICRIVLERRPLALGCAIALGLVMASFWFGMPMIRKRRAERSLGRPEG